MAVIDERPEGFYWVRVRDDKITGLATLAGWQIAKFVSGRWYFAGLAAPYPERVLERIGPRVLLRPAAGEQQDQTHDVPQNDFKPGDVVVLKGTIHPRMTVVRLDEGAVDARCWCIWHTSDGHLLGEWFPPVVLRHPPGPTHPPFGSAPVERTGP